MNLSSKAHAPQAAILEWTAGIGAVTAEALALREGRSVRSARAHLLAAERAGMLTRERPLNDQPALFTATRAGLRAVGLSGLDPARVSAASARHSIVCAHVAAALERLYPDHRVMGERELLREQSGAPQPLASACLGKGADGAALLHRPDIVLWPRASASTLPIAVEVELTVKASRRLAAICRAWARSRSVSGVLYLAAGDVRGALGRAIAAARAGERIAVVDLESLGAASLNVPVAHERTIPERA